MKTDITEDIITLHEQGLSRPEIAARLGTTYSVVESRLRRAGLKPHLTRQAPVKTSDIIALHEQGLSPSEIAARLNITYHSAWLSLKGAGLKPHPAPPPPIPTEDIIALHEQGLSAIEIAARLNVAPGLIRYRLRQAGYEPIVAPMFLKAAERTADIIRLHKEGLTPKQIAEKLDIDWSLVYHRLRDAKLAPHPSAEEAANTLERLDEIIRLAKEGVLRHEIAKRTGSTWPLVAEALEGSSVKPVWPACGELTTWASELLPVIDEIREAHPDTEPILRKVEQLEEELVAISDAAWAVRHRLPWVGARAERGCVGDITQACSDSLYYIDALKGCVEQLDWAKLPKLLEQAEICIESIYTAMTEAISKVAEPESLEHHPNPRLVSIGDSVCDKYTGACGPIVDILNDEVLIEPTTRKRVDKEYLEVAETPIRVKKINLEPDHIRREEAPIIHEAITLSPDPAEFKSPISPHCERVLEEPPRCYDFRGIRSYVLCKAWDIMEKEKRTRLPVGEAWSEARRSCKRE